MKTMKTLVLAMFAALALFSCNEEVDDEVVIRDPINRDLGESFHGNFALLVEEQYIGGNSDHVEIRSHMEGNGDLSLMSASTLELDHIMEIQSIHGENNILEGTFRIWSESGAEIFGEYKSVLNQGEITQVFANVKGGYKSFKGVSGELSIQLRRISSRERNAVVNGRIYNYAPSKVE